MLNYEKISEDPLTLEDHTIISDFFEKNIGSIKCDGCGTSLQNQFRIIPKNSASNPFERPAILHLLGSSESCRIRQCSACKEIVTNTELTRCPKCDGVIPRNITEVF